MDNTKIVEKIRKLLALANNNTSVEEAGAAMAAAQRLMSEYQIEQAMLEDAADAGPTESVAHDVLYDDGGRVLARWRWVVASSLCKANGCKAFSLGGGKLGYIGRASDAQTIRYMFTYITAEIDRLCGQAAGAHDCEARGKGYSKTWRNSFRVGAANEVSNRLAQAVRAVHREAQEAGKGTALAVIQTHKEALDLYGKKVLHLRSGGSSSTNLDGGAYAAGREAGKGINLGKGTARLGGPSPMLKG